MQTYLKTRGRLLSVAASVGTLFSSFLFRVYLEEIRNYFNLGVFSKHQFPVLLAVFVLPILAAYIVLYFSNRLLIWFYGTEELLADDLLDEYAWSSIKPFWRHK